MPEAKCNFRVPKKRKKKSAVSRLWKFQVGCPAEKKIDVTGKMFLTARDHNVRRNLSFQRFIRAHAKPTPWPRWRELKINSIKIAVSTHASATLVLPPSHAGTRAPVHRTAHFPAGPEIIGAAHWLPPGNYHYNLHPVVPNLLHQPRTRPSIGPAMVLDTYRVEFKTLFVVTITSRIQRGTS